MRQAGEGGGSTGRAVRLVAWAVAFGLAGPAAADVLEIAADGSALLRTGAGAVQWNGPVSEAASEAADLQIPADIRIPVGATLSTASRAPAPYAAAVQRISARHGLSPALLEAVAWHESRWQPNAVSRVGAIGLVQLMPATARALGVDPRNPYANLDGGARLLRQLLDLFDGDVEKALAAYDAGPARVTRADGVPAIAETRAYVAAILGRLASTPNGD